MASSLEAGSPPEAPRMDGLTVPVRAAGGVVWRRGDDGAIQVLVVHRPKYDDWSLPKGKCESGEPDHVCAHREVLEETGIDCELGAELPSTEYHDRFGRAKVVRYWAMTPGPGRFMPTDEVDRIEWVGAGEVGQWLSYERDVVPVVAMAQALDVGDD
jgi:8-oxo-dGTP pyrophosphatase MutT (NUDIX family)